MSYFRNLKRCFRAAFLSSLLLISSCNGGGGGTQQPAADLPVSVAIIPDTATLKTNESGTFTATVTGSANAAVAWTIKEGPLGGAITPDGVYTASSTPSSYHLIATSQADPTKSAIAVVNVIPPTSVNLMPSAATLLPGEPLTFEAAIVGSSDKGVAWTVEEPGGGAIGPDGAYTAPAAEGTFHVKAISQADPSQAAEATVTVTPSAPLSVTIEPEAIGLTFGESSPFKAWVTGSFNKGVSWSVQEGNGGAVGPDGIYTAPHTEGTFHVVASSAADPAKKGIAAVTVAPPNGSTIERVSVDSNGAEANDFSLRLFISGDGRYVAFESYATNLVPGDTNGWVDMFVHDRQTKTTRRISVDSAGAQANNISFGSKINWDGRYILFESEASNLVPGDTNGFPDVFVYDQNTGQVERISVDSAGQQGNSASEYSYISRDGRYVAFLSHASNLVPGDTNNAADIFVRDRVTGETSRVSVSSEGAQADQHSFCPSISDDGRYISFVSYATNLVPGDTNGVPDIFVHDRQTHTTQRVSVDSNGLQADLGSSDAKISGNGRYVAIAAEATNLVPGDTNGVGDLFVYDLVTRTTTLVSVSSKGVQGNKKSFDARISADGRYVSFDSDATNLVEGDTNGKRDVFVHDRLTGKTTRLSVSAAGVQGDGMSEASRMSADGRYVAFRSEAGNLVGHDTNRAADIFVAAIP